MSEQLNGKVVVITGASSGFGRGAALAFARKGACVVLAARREDVLDELVEECRDLGAPAIAVPADVSHESDVVNLASIAVNQFGRIDVWINNAGAAAVGVYTDVPLADHVQVIRTDLIGTIYGSYLALKQFRLQGAGILINVASMLGKIPAPYYASYSAAKHGVVGLTTALRQELKLQKQDDIHACTVLPMAMDTPFFAHAANYSGHETVPIPPVDDAQKVIDRLVELASNPKDEVPVGAGSGSNQLLHNLAPVMSEAAMSYITHKAQMEDAPAAPPTSGSLRRPINSGVGIKDPKLRRQ